jgi:hypothetical protein
MIALFQLGLPADILVLAETQLQAIEAQGAEVEGVGPVTVIVHPPYRSQLSESVFRVGNSAPLFDDIGKLNPADPQPVEPMIDVDGYKVVRCDAIAVEIHGSEFDRRRDGGGIRPLLDLACSVADGLLQRVRVLTRAGHLKPIDPESTTFGLVFLDDSRVRLASEEGKFVGTGMFKLQIRSVALTPEVWDATLEAGAYETPAWEELLLDAMDSVLSEIGPALVLSATAVETRIANALDFLAGGKVPDDVWKWATTRNGDFMKTPSVSEQLDALLLALGGRSLREDTRLWEAGVHLRQARNSFVHEGRAMIGKKKEKRQAVTQAKAAELVGNAGAIIDFIETLLPEEARRPRLSHQPMVTTTIPIKAPEEESEADTD